MPGVESVTAITFTFAGLVDPEDGALENSITFAGHRPATSHLVAGRDPSGLGEFVVDQGFASAYDAQLGDVYRVDTLTQEQADAADFSFTDPAGPSFDAELVGIFRSA